VRKERGQSMVELALVLPLLVLLIIGLVEAGVAMRNYLVVMAANREGIRFAARGRFEDEVIAQRIISAGGLTDIQGSAVPFLRTTGTAPNTGIIITHFPILADGTVLTPTRYLTGTVCFTQTRPIQVSDSRVVITATMWHVTTTTWINDLRQANDYEQLDNQIIFLEVFYAHNTLWASHLMPGSPWMFYTHSSMRVVSDSRMD